MTPGRSGRSRAGRRSVATLVVLVILQGSGARAADERGAELPAPRIDLAAIGLPATRELDSSTRILIEDAENWVRELDGQHPDLGEAYGSLGRVYLAYGFDVPARDCFANAAVLEPGRFQWQYYKGYTALRTADVEAAAAAFETALGLRPDDVPARARLGVAYRRAGRLNEARHEFQEVIAQGGDQAFAHSGLGNIELEGGNWFEAVEHLEAALRLQPQATSLYNPLALAYRQLGDRDRAKSLLEKRGVGVVAMADPLLDEARRLATGTQLLLHRGSAAARQGRTQEALEMFEEALLADPGNAIAHYNAGALYLAQQQTERALAEFRRAIELDPGYQIAYLNLGSVLSRLGRYDEAIEQLERALEIDAADPATRQNLANALVRSGRCAAALEH
jgi:protein O-GlcNAc transferase